VKPVNITFCSCNKYLEKNQWKTYKTLKDLVVKKIRKQVPKAKVTFIHFHVPENHKEKITNDVLAEFKNREHVVEVVLKHGKCTMCSKEGTDYFEAVLQVRSTNYKVLEESIEFLKRKVDNLRQKGVFINKVQRFENGYDLYITNKRVTQALGRELCDTFGGLSRASPHLQTKSRQTSKNVYRVNVMVKLPGFVKGDIILANDKVLRVDKLGKKIKLFDLRRNSSLSVDYSKLQYHILKKHSTYVSRLYPALEVINPYDYQSSMVKNKPAERPELGQEVNVVVHKGVYIVD